MINKKAYENKLLKRIKQDDIIQLIKKRDVQIIAMKFEIEETVKGWLQYYVNDKILFFYGSRENKNVIQINLNFNGN